MSDLPALCDIHPSGHYSMHSLDKAAGIPVVTKELAERKLLHLEAATVSGLTVGEIIKQAAEAL